MLILHFKRFGDCNMLTCCKRSCDTSSFMGGWGKGDGCVYHFFSQLRASPYYIHGNQVQHPSNNISICLGHEHEPDGQGGWGDTRGGGRHRSQTTILSGGSWSGGLQIRGRLTIIEKTCSAFIKSAIWAQKPHLYFEKKRGGYFSLALRGSQYTM